MDDWSDDEVEASSSVGSASSSLPQLIREALESVRAELKSYIDRGSDSTSVETPSVAMDVDDETTASKSTSETAVTEMASQARVNSGVRKAVPQTPHQVLSESKEEKLNINRILTDAQKANTGHWIKIDLPTKKPCILKNTPRILKKKPPPPTTTTSESHQLVHDSETVPTQQLKETGSVGIPGLQTQTGHTRRIENHELQRKKPMWNNATENIAAIDAETQTNFLERIRTIPNTGLPNYVKSPAMDEESMETQGTDGSFHECDELEIVVDKSRTPEDDMSTGMEIRRGECSPDQKSISDPGDEDWIDAFDLEGPAKILECEKPFHTRGNVFSTDVELQTTNRAIEQDESTNGELAHETLEEKQFSEDEMSATRIYREFNTGCEDIEDFARVCDDKEIIDIENIKVEEFEDDDYQEIQRDVLRGNSDFGVESTSEFALDSSATRWRQELLSSDFSLIYGSLRAILMSNISTDVRQRLIQTMIATMGEIQAITMGEGNPVQQSVRCGTPVLSEELEVVDEIRESEDEDDEPEEIKKESLGPSLSDVFKTQNASKMNIQDLRERETMMNRERMSKLMKVNPDGTVKCLVCLKDEIPPDRTCRACSAFSYRVERNYTLGIAIPTCRHKNYRCSPRCKSCRFRKFSFMSMTDKDTRLRDVRERMCPVCKKNSYSFRGWKCRVCANFFGRLIRKHESVTCKHSGEYPDTCDGCRCYCLREEWNRHEPRQRPFPLPLEDHLS